MELAAAAMTPLIEKLGHLLASELNLEKSVRKDVDTLERELKVMYVKLREVSEVRPDRIDEGTKLWAADVRELSYDMADAIDAFTLRVGEVGPTNTGLRGFLDRTARLFTKGKQLHKVADAIRDAKDRAKELGEIHQRYAGLKLQDTGHNASDIDPRLTAMYTEVVDLVGVDSARDELIKVLSDPLEVDVKTVSVVGFGGLGKTTLAKVVYDKIKVEFDCAAFVSVSRNPDITRIFQLILFEFDKNRYANTNVALWDIKQLIDELRGFLQDKRYLVVIDDLWDETNWKFIKCAFPKNTHTSRLITTTRIHNVSEASCSSDSDIIYKMKPLSDSDSLKLFHSRIFHRAHGCPPELEQVSTDIMKKCGGVPLAIITVASLLASRKQVKTKDQWLVLLNSIGHELKSCSSVEDMHKILSLSYYDLPSQLKPCLLYLGIFPEDYVIDRDRLIWRWIAEGFVQRENTSGYDDLFEIGLSYFIELVNRSMIQPIYIDLEHKEEACRVHDMVLDLIRSLTSNENFVTVWDKDEQTTSSHGMTVARRLSIQNSSTARQGQATITDMSKVRSFTIFESAIDLMPSLTQFQVVRVLDLEGCDLRKCGSQMNLRQVGRLCQLRYLGLRGTHIRELPIEVGKLQFLQTLDLTSCRGIQELPQTITGLRNLMRLRLDHSDTRLPKGLDNLTSLEELTGVSVHYDDDPTLLLKELGHLTGLRVLELSWSAENFGEALVQSLGNLRKLQSLDIRIFSGRGNLMRGWAPPPCLRRFLCLGTNGELPTLSAWIKNSSSSLLTFVDVLIRQVCPEDLHVLGALPSLRIVRLWSEGRHSVAGMKVKAGAFPCARMCAFMHFATAPSMFAPGAMPRVQHLRFTIWAWDFGGFGLDDLRMGHLPSLEEVVVGIWCRQEKKEEDMAVVERVEAALRQAAEDHPNRLALDVSRKISPSYYHQWRT